MTNHATLADLEAKAREFHRLWCGRERCFGPISRDYEMAEMALAQQERMNVPTKEES